MTKKQIALMVKDFEAFLVAREKRRQRERKKHQRMPFISKGAMWQHNLCKLCLAPSRQALLHRRGIALCHYCVRELKQYCLTDSVLDQLIEGNGEEAQALLLFARAEAVNERK